MTEPSTTQFAVETWKLAHRLTLDIYKVASQLPLDERQALGLDLRKRSVGVASSIVAGHARKDETEFAGHVTEAVTTLEETKYSLLVARDLGFIAEVTYDRLMADAEHVTERLEELRGRLLPAAAPEAAAPAIEHTPEELPAAAEPQDNGMFMPADHQPTFTETKSVSSAAKDLWNWLKGTPGRFSKEDDIAGRVWTEDSAGTPNYLEHSEEEPARK